MSGGEGRGGAGEGREKEICGGEERLRTRWTGGKRRCETKKWRSGGLNPRDCVGMHMVVEKRKEEKRVHGKEDFLNGEYNRLALA